ncbi:hypothetical protein [Oceanobacillus sojae]|uniref:hypothetical protein n=1 Tax=Oceanobacillus sojae TaxID=582851 RepID=UPI0021A54F45|nr:hypothetical protein [Oceanobacillus sojae]MCT1904108.1 hypothetical protein [Oceanobacillus sojae]
MKNEAILKQAIELLKEVNTSELETVEISHTKYDDGSIGFSVDLTYPADEVTETIIKVDGEVVSRSEK